MIMNKREDSELDSVGSSWNKLFIVSETQHPLSQNKEVIMIVKQTEFQSWKDDSGLASRWSEFGS